MWPSLIPMLFLLCMPHFGCQCCYGLNKDDKTLCSIRLKAMGSSGHLPISLNASSRMSGVMRGSNFSRDLRSPATVEGDAIGFDPPVPSPAPDAKNNLTTSIGSLTPVK
eukprot:gnl/Chilomastix_caulleri/3230.p1 GENE.gnl/Chilomastix_caulleri/3230~~gnl/Chilomastix_caulleri/3230.p1  ORF type:complete len:109 (+),score=19.95 gnl/Chilomastix_caulleri/3230:86-412(+)